MVRESADDPTNARLTFVQQLQGIHMGGNVLSGWESGPDLMQLQEAVVLDSTVIPPTHSKLIGTH